MDILSIKTGEDPSLLYKIMFSSKVISASQLKPVKAKQSTVMKDILQKGGSEVLRTDIDKKRFWSAMRKDSQSRGFGERGYTKGNLENFFAKMLNDKNDSFTDKKIKKLMKTMDVKESKVVNRAAELREEGSKIKRELHQQKEAETQIKAEEKKDAARKYSEVRPLPTQLSQRNEEFNKFDLEYKKQHERQIPRLKTFHQQLPTSKAQQISTLTNIPRPTISRQTLPPKEQKIQTNVKLFGKSQSKIEEAAQARQLIHEINDPEDYGNQDSS